MTRQQSTYSARKWYFRLLIVQPIITYGFPYTEERMQYKNKYDDDEEGDFSEKGEKDVPSVYQVHTVTADHQSHAWLLIFTIIFKSFEL